MKSALLIMGGFCAALVALMMVESKRKKPVAELAHNLELAWADHHTVA